LQTLATWHQPRRASADVHYGYDARGQQLFARFGSVSGQGITNTWDGFGQQLTSSTDMGGVTRTFGYEYDAAGNRIRITHPDLNYFTTDYDGLNRATAILENGTATLVTIAYDALGRRTSLTRPGAGTTSYAYDGASRLQSLGHDLGGTANDVSFTFGFNPASQILSRANSNDVFVFTGSLPAAATSTINGLNQIAVHNGATFAHDANGNLTFDGGTTYTYDVENRLVSAAGARNGTLTYDPLGRLSTSTAQGATPITFLYDGDVLAAEFNQAGSMLLRYVARPGAHIPLVQYQGATLANRRFLHADERGSIVAWTDAAGAVTATNRYDEYGIPASGNSGRIGYTGQMWLPGLGLWYYRARMYTPYLGRFMQTDPVGYDDQINLYAYVGNDPINNIDPNGLATITWNENRDRAHVTFYVRIESRGGEIDFDAESLNEFVSNAIQGEVEFEGRIVTITSSVVVVGADDHVTGGTDVKTIIAHSDASLREHSAQSTHGLSLQSHVVTIGAREIHLQSGENVSNVAHELAHTAGAGGQRIWDVDASGQLIQSGTFESSLMNMSHGRANTQTLREVLSFSGNINVRSGQ
jgi:RHS repeat-associated protein